MASYHPAMTERRTLDDLLADARAGLDRVGPQAASDAAAAGGLLVDIRPIAQRRADGQIPGALVIERNVLEWRLAPGSAHRIPEATDADQTVVIVCNEGYASSLAAATLQELGLRNATDLVGGFVAWKAAHLPTIPGSDA